MAFQKSSEKKPVKYRNNWNKKGFRINSAWLKYFGIGLAVVALVFGIWKLSPQLKIVRKVILDPIAKIGNKPDSKVSKNATNTRRTSTSITRKMGKEASWPKEVPASLPKFTDGIIYMSLASNSGRKTWTMTYRKVKSGALEEYKHDLTASGWKLAKTRVLKNLTTIHATKGDFDVFTAFNQKVKTAVIRVAKRK